MNGMWSQQNEITNESKFKDFKTHIDCNFTADFLIVSG